MASPVVSFSPSVDPVFEDRQAADNGASKPQAEIPQPTETHQILELRETGQTVSEIAVSLVVPQTQVESTLGLTTQPGVTTGQLTSILA